MVSINMQVTNIFSQKYFEFKILWQLIIIREFYLSTWWKDGFMKPIGDANFSDKFTVEKKYKCASMSRGIVIY